jgi:hypothetical protein
MGGRIRQGKRVQLAFRPLLEGCERRESLSGIIASAVASGGLAARARPRVHIKATGTAFTPPTSPPDRFVSPPGVPTKATLAKTRFQATFVGPYHIGPGRTSAESSQLYIRGSGRSNFFLHGTTQLRAAVPTDTTVAPTGVVVMLDRNINNAGQLGLDLTADPSSVDASGRIRRFTWTVDSSYSSGVFTNASGQGTLVVTYGNQGIAAMIARGRILTQGVGDPSLNSTLDPGR